MNILVTGATGFVGSVLCQTLVSHSASVTAIIRSASQVGQLPAGVKPLMIDSLTSPVPSDFFRGIDAIVHLAARVHQMKDHTMDPLTVYREINTQATLSLATAARLNGVRRFIYLSSIKVNGEGQPFNNSQAISSQSYTEEDTPQPRDPYGQSKWEAEQLLQQLAQETELEVVILRPPLIYGPNVKANFRQLIRVIKSGIPLPLGNVNNRRSFLYVGNLADAITICLSHPLAAGQTFLLSDGEDLSTPELIRRLAASLGTSSRLFSCPPHFLQWVGQMTGKSASLDRLLGSLMVDSRKICQTLNWKPPFTVTQGLQATADWYLNVQS